MKLLAGVKPVSDGWIALFKSARIATEDIDRTGLPQKREPRALSFLTVTSKRAVTIQKRELAPAAASASP